MSLPPGYRFTELCMHDLTEVMRIERSASDFPWCIAHFEDALRNGHTGLCIRRIEGALCGYCLWMPVVDEVHLLNLCVTPNAQRKGFGLAFLDRAVQCTRAVGGASLLLEVGVSNLRALHLYRRFGFVVIGTRKNYYVAADGACEDACVMRLTLPEIQYAAA